MSSWSDLIAYYRAAGSPSPSLKVATLAQWIIESGNGTSDLATKHLNFAGLKFRARMTGHATPVDYTGSDGVPDTYCKFDDVESFVNGYWHFVASGPYGGWEEFDDDGAGYIRHLALHHYAQDPDYLPNVLKRFERASALLNASAVGSAEHGSGAHDTSLARVGVVVGHNRVARGAVAVAPINRFEYEYNAKVASLMKSAAAEYNLAMEVFLREPQAGGHTAEVRAAYAAVEKWRPDCAIELHFNATAGASGTETLHRRDSSEAARLAHHVQDAVVHVLKLSDRGLKPKSASDRGAGSLFALNKVPTILAEPFFGSSAFDCQRLAVVGEKALARAYLIGLRDWATARGLHGSATASMHAVPVSPLHEIDAMDV